MYTVIYTVGNNHQYASSRCAYTAIGQRGATAEVRDQRPVWLNQSSAPVVYCYMIRTARARVPSPRWLLLLLAAWAVYCLHRQVTTERHAFAVLLNGRSNSSQPVYLRLLAHSHRLSGSQIPLLALCAPSITQHVRQVSLYFQGCWS